MGAAQREAVENRLWWAPRGRAVRILGCAQVPVLFLGVGRFRGTDRETALIEEAHSGLTHEVQTGSLFNVSDMPMWELFRNELLIEANLLDVSVTVGALVRELARDARHKRTVDAVLVAARRLNTGTLRTV